MTPPSDLTGRNVIIAGGTRGLGLAIARTFGRAGAGVAVCGRDEAQLARAADILRADGATVSPSAVDVTAPDALRRWLESAAAELGSVDVFVPSAAANWGPERWSDGFRSVLFYLAEACDILEPHLARAGGNVVFISSVAASMTDSGRDQRVYGAAKAAVAHLSGQLAREWGPHGIRVNTVSPGPIITTDGYWERLSATDPDAYDAVRSRSSMGRFVTEDEVALAVLFLAGPAASGITGANLRVDAGFLGHAQF